MSFMHTVTMTFATAQSVAITQAVTAEDAAETNVDESIADGTQPQLPIAFVHGQLKSFFALSTKDVTLKTNSSGAPDNTLALKANVPYFWSSQGAVANPFTVAVTSIFVNNASGQTAAVKLRILHDPTA